MRKKSTQEMAVARLPDLENLSQLDVELRENLMKAVLLLERSLIDEMMPEINQIDDQLAAGIIQLVSNYRYDIIRKKLEEIAPKEE